MLEHGGQIRAAAERYGIDEADWLDLSTGINPVAYVPPSIPLDAWQRLPQEQDGLLAAAAAYYGTTDLIAVAGSQAAIQQLPRLRGAGRVGVLHPGYAEHAHAWRNAGHEVVDLAVQEVATNIDRLDVLVLMQPNNPTGTTFSHVQLQEWHARLLARKGWLIVDEAFIDASRQESIVQPLMPQGLIVLRSLGKFFGLAGARVGFVMAHADLLVHMQGLLGPWGVTGPSRFVAQAALLDREWQTNTRVRLQQDGLRLEQLLRDAQLIPAGGCELFQWVLNAQAESIHVKLAQRGILTRLFARPRSLRFGLPGAEPEWARLAAALEETGKS